MQAQAENIHIAAAPYTPDANNPDALFWETLEVNSAAVRTYAVNSGAITLWAGIGYSAVYSAEGLERVVALAAVPFADEPLLYDSINTTGFGNSTYYTNGEQSWGVLKEIVNGFPNYIPKVIGTYVLRKTILISDLLNYTAT